MAAKIKLNRCYRGCGPIFCCCLLTHYGDGACKCRCHRKERQLKGSGKLRLAKHYTGMHY